MSVCKKFYSGLNSENKNFKNDEQSKKFKPNEINKRYVKLCPTLKKNKTKRQIFFGKDLNKLNTNLDINKPKFNSVLSITEGNTKAIHKNKKYNEYVRNMTTTNFNKKNNNIYNKKNNFIYSSKNNEKTFPIFINQNIKIILKNHKMMGKNYKHNLTNGEINLNKNKSINNISDYKTKYLREISSDKFSKTMKNPRNLKEIKNISMIKKDKQNWLNNVEKNKIFIEHLLYKTQKTKFNKRIIKLETKENLKEKNDLSRNNDFGSINNLTCDECDKKIKFKKRINLNKENYISIYKSNKTGKTIKNKYYVSLKKSRNLDKNNFTKEKKEVKYKNNHKVKDLKQLILLKTNEYSPYTKDRDSLINRVFHFMTDNNNIFNDIEEEGYLTQDIKSLGNLNESHKGISFNKNDNKNANKTDKNLVQKKNIIKKNFDSSQLKQLNISEEINIPFVTNNIEKSNNDSNNENSKKDKDYNSFKNKIKEFKTNKEIIKGKNKIKGIKMNINRKKIKFQSKSERKNKLYELLKCNNFIKIIFSFCEKDINLLNKISMISKDIYLIIKPLIYKILYTLINNCNEKNKTKNRIKLYLMKNYSSLINLSSSILYIKYNELLFENNKYDNEIKKDLTRTFPDNILFKCGNICYNKLYHILIVYSNLNKNIGYVQGINFLAAHIINIFEDEKDELIFLDALINKLNLDKIFVINYNNKFYEKISNSINSSIIQQIPKLYKYLFDVKLNIDFFTTSWILTLFSDSMDNEFLIIIWDYMIIFGWKFVKYFIVNILLIFENDILNTNQDNLTYIKKNILRNEKFKINFQKILRDTEEMLINNTIIF